jgi:hypothetical protein
MQTKQKAKGSWGVRFFILLLGIVLGILFYWLLSFIEGDIGQIKQPDPDGVRQKYIEPSLDRQAVELGREIDAIKREMQTLTEQQRLLSSSTSSLQNTISQLLTIQKESLAKKWEFPKKASRPCRIVKPRFWTISRNSRCTTGIFRN